MSTTPQDIRRPPAAATGARAAGGQTKGARVRGVARHALSSARRVPLVLAVLLVVAFVHATAWAITIAPLNGPDEVAHIAYVQHLVETGSPPDRGTGHQSLSTWLSMIGRDLGVNPILGHVDGRPDWNAAGAVDREVGALPPAARADGDGPNAAAANPPLYYLYGSVAWIVSPDRSPLGQLFFLRMASVLLFVLTVAFTWLLAAELFTRIWPRAVATSLVALHPKVAMIGAVVNPDILLICAGTAFLWTGVRLVKRGPTLGGVAAFAAATAANVLTHGRGFYVLPVAALVGLYLLWRFRPRVRDALKFTALGGGLILAAALMTYLWTRAHSGGAALGGQVSVSPHYNTRQFLSYLWQFYLPKLGFMDTKVGGDYGYRQVYVDAFYGSLGYLEINFSSRLYDLLQLGGVLGFVALYTTAVARWQTVRANWPVVTFVAVTFLALLGVIHYVSYSSLSGGVDPIITGRYLFPAIALYGAAAAWVAGSLPRKIGLPFAGFLVGVHILLAIGALGLAAARFYV